MEKHLSRIHTRWRRLIVSLYLSALILLGRFYKRRSGVHWVGYTKRAKRYERACFITIYFGAMAIFDARDFMLWAIVWGGMMSLFLNLYTVYRLVPRKREHWIKN